MELYEKCYNNQKLFYTTKNWQYTIVLKMTTQFIMIMNKYDNL